MRSNGLATILLMIPVLTVPALAIFGIPQFAPVVASPLDEGVEKDRESRVGNSARQSQDDLFGDVEDFGSEPAVKEEPWSRRRDASTSSSNRKGSQRRSNDSLESAWNDDTTAADSDLARKPRRRSSLSDSDSVPLQEVPVAKSNLKKSSFPERASRDNRRSLPEGNADNGIRLASVADMDQGVEQAGFADDSEVERPKSPPSRSRAPAINGAKRRDAAAEPLNWQSAQERLNELEIRSFRLEPSHQLGQFLFICSYTPPDNPRVSYRFEASAEQPLRAVEKVLEQIVEWRQKR